MYGHNFKINYKGQDKINSGFGALVTLATYTLMLINLVTLLQAFNDGSK